jgi:signal transduction histidine kinase
LAATGLSQSLTPSNTWLHRWIYYLAAGFMFAAASLRAALVYQHSPLLGKIMLLLAASLLAFAGSSLLTSRSSRLPALLIGLEILLVLALLLVTHSDFFAFLFAIVGMQAMQQYASRVAAVLIGLMALLTLASLVRSMGIFQALALTLACTAVSAFLATYIGSTRRARVIQDRQQMLAGELQETNRKLEMYSQQARQLAAGRERQRLARELHDSVTQTIFSMTLTTQSALLLLERDPAKVSGQLDRLDDLAQGAQSEMQVLISELAPEARSGGGFLASLKQHLADRQRLDGLSVSLEAEGSQPLNPAEAASLFRIAQEALNNIVKHAGVPQAVLRLHLTDPFWMEIEDRGAGFDPQQAGGGGRVGLAGMHERAAEIGWNLRVESAPGAGTRIRVEKDPERTGQV